LISSIVLCYNFNKLTYLLINNACLRLPSSVVVCRRRPSGFVTLHDGRRACRRLHSRRPCNDVMPLQVNYSFTVTLHGGPVMLRPVSVTPCQSRFAELSVTIV